MTQIKITTDNEWGADNGLKGKYQLLEAEYLEDRLQIMCLGDLLPTGTIKTVGAVSLFKVRIKELIAKDPSISNLSLVDQIPLVYDLDPAEFMENYRDAPRFVREGAAFLKQSQLPVMVSITGNREFDYQGLFDMMVEREGIPEIDYMDELNGCGKFSLLRTPQSLYGESTGFLFVPYDPEHDCAFFRSHLEHGLDRLNDRKPERIAVMTHENPNPEAVGKDRKAKNQTTLDYCLGQVAKFPIPATCFCWHLDVSAEPFMYNGVIVQPVSGSETVIFNSADGSYTKKKMEVD
ncbi:MAG: hypothetical protein ABII01_00985 [Candidatus Woesearchaeota archaeon]